MTPARHRLGALVALVAAPPAAAAPPPALAPAIASAPAAALAPAAPAAIAAALAQAVALGRAGDCAGAIRLLDPMLPGLGGAERNAAQRVRLVCLHRVGRDGEVASVWRELSTTVPDDALVLSFGVVAAATAGDYRAAAERLTAIAERKPEALRILTGALWQGIAQKLGEEGDHARRDRTALALARVDWQPDDQPDLREGLARGAINAALADRDLAGARDLLGRVTLPGMLTAMATARSYAPLWPDIEARLGPNGGHAADAFAAPALDAFANAPDQAQRRLDAMRAFVVLGRLADVVELGRPVVAGPAFDQTAMLIVAVEVEALVATGRRDAAIERLRPIAASDLVAQPQAAPAVVMLADLLDEAGRPAEALAVARANARRTEVFSTYGAGWLRRTEACALAGLGDRAAAAAVAAALPANANPVAAVEALLCTGETDRAADLAVATLASAEGADRLVGQFQPESAQWAPDGSRTRALWRDLLRRPAVAAAFERRARILPASLRPAREPRDIPHLRGRIDPAATT